MILVVVSGTLIAWKSATLTKCKAISAYPESCAMAPIEYDDPCRHSTSYIGFARSTVMTPAQ
jgi:hypothetical protein